MSNFQSMSKLGKIVKYADFKEGDVIFNNATFLGVTENQYGNLYNFKEEGGEKFALPKCGKLEWLRKELVAGAKYRVIYLGKKEIEKGAFKGKSFHDLDVQIDLDSTADIDTIIYEEGLEDEDLDNLLD